MGRVKESLRSFVLVSVLVFAFVGVGFGEEKQEKHLIDVWLGKCIEKDDTTAGKVSCVMQAINMVKECALKGCKEGCMEKYFDCLAIAERLWDKVTDNKSIQKMSYDYLPTIRKKNEKYREYIWKHLILKDFSKSEIETFGISKDDILIIETDLNDDGLRDLIVTVADNPFYCEKFSTICDLWVFLAKPNGGFHIIDVYARALYNMPIYIVDIKKNGLKKLVVDGRFILEFDGKKTFYIKP